jgi:zinc protease
MTMGWGELRGAAGRASVLLVLAAAAAVVPALAARAAQEEQVTERVFLVRDKPGAATRFQMIVHAGCYDEPEGQCRGLAHFLEHLVLTGRNREHTDLAVRLFPDVSSNGWTSARATGYVHTVPARDGGPKADLEKLFTFYAARLHDFAVSDAEAARERNVVLQEHDWRIASSPFNRFYRKLDRELLPDHPAGQWTIGTRESILSLTVEDARAFHRTWYAVNKAYFMVRADISAVDLKAIADKALAGLKPKQLPPRTAANHRPAITIERKDFTESDAQVTRPRVTYRKLVHMPGTDTVAQRAARAVLADFLRSRLPSSPHDVLVDRGQLASATPSVSIDRVAPDTLVLRMSAEAAPEAAPDALLGAIASYVEGLGTFPPSPESVTRLKRRIADARANQDHDPALVYSRLVAWLGARRTYQEYLAWPRHIAEVSDADVGSAAAALSAPGRIVTGMLLPAEDAGK